MIRFVEEKRFLFLERYFGFDSRIISVLGFVVVGWGSFFYELLIYKECGFL